MAIRMEKPWIELTAEAVKALPGQLGVYQLADAAGKIVLHRFSRRAQPVRPAQRAEARAARARFPGGRSASR